MPGLNTEAPCINLESGRSLGSFSLCRQSIGSRGGRLGDGRVDFACH
jgi:hypothetical protein